MSDKARLEIRLRSDRLGDIMSWESNDWIGVQAGIWVRFSRPRDEGRGDA